MTSNLQDLARAWAVSQDIEGERTPDHMAPIFAVHSLLVEPEQLWSFVLAAEPLCTAERSFGMLGTGPLEDLIQEHGAAYVDRIEQQAAANPRFAQLFKHVWVPADQDPITQRYLALGCTPVGTSA